MDTFAFMYSREKFSEHVLHHWAEVTKKWMPRLGVDLIEGYQFFQECHSGWFWLMPALKRDVLYISEAINTQYGVIAFGDVLGESSQVAAQTILHAWETAGPEGVRGLEGDFSSVILDRTNGHVTLIGDAMGRRALSYYANGETLFVSPHDVVLAATGRIPVSQYL